MTEITIEITDYCPNQCAYCSSNAGPDQSTFLPYDWLVTNFANSSKTWDRINISGGEPLAHPDFWKILQLCKKYVTPRMGLVAVYTNAFECIVFNANIIPGVRVEANVPILPNTDQVHVLKMLQQGLEAKRPQITCSHNWDHKCENCGHLVVRPDRSIDSSPCKKH